ncbi:MAG: c-type cytochrome, partial [Aquabacterium sp.]
MSVLWAHARSLAAAALAAAALLGAGGASAQADAARRERFNTQCLACHGEVGASRLALIPSLSGQHGFYAITQLFLFREGRRDNPAMTEAARGMSDADLQG